jgi:hypothetical protein
VCGAAGGVEARCRQQLLHHRRRAVELGDLLVADHAQRLRRLPAVHEDQAAPVAQGGEQLGMQATDVEQRHRREVAGARPRAISAATAFGRGHARQRHQ